MIVRIGPLEFKVEYHPGWCRQWWVWLRLWRWELGCMLGHS